MTQSYQGSLPPLDEGVERVDNSEHLQVGTVGIKQVTLLDSNGSPIGGLNLPTYDYVERVVAPANVETWTFKVGGSGGRTVSTVVIVYTDFNLQTIVTVTKT